MQQKGEEEQEQESSELDADLGDDAAEGTAVSPSSRSAAPGKARKEALAEVAEEWGTEQIAEEVSRRRNFAIISHPDAGKTTLPVQTAQVRGSGVWSLGSEEFEFEAGIERGFGDGQRLLPGPCACRTPCQACERVSGLQGSLFSLYGGGGGGGTRTLAAADNAVMLVDGGKGLEPQTRKLFEVCRMRQLPIFTFMNKMDRPALEPLELLDQIEREFGLATFPVNWPIGSGDRRLLLHKPLTWPELGPLAASWRSSGPPEEVELLEELTPPLDLEAMHAGELSPVFFGSAANNFGVELFLDSFLEYAVTPGAHESDLGDVAPELPHFTGFVFKLQANMDPKHRDKVAFVRICSGRFEKGMKVQLARTGRTVALTRPQKMFAQDRSTVESGFAGDGASVIGLNNPGVFAIGDTVYTGPRRVFPAIPSFSPELFCYLRNPNPSKYKQFQKGLNELLGEGAVQVVQYRMQSEYGVETTLEPLGYCVARWVAGGWPALDKVGRLYNCATVKDQGDHPEIGELMPYALPPVETPKK
eukprot:jgi/Mesen1/4888/ME000244S04066